MDRLGRSTQDLIAIVPGLRKRRHVLHLAARPRARAARLGRPPAMTDEQVRHSHDLLARPGSSWCPYIPGSGPPSISETRPWPVR